jgi:hypothetical protein
MTTTVTLFGARGGSGTRPSPPRSTFRRERHPTSLLTHVPAGFAVSGGQFYPAQRICIGRIISLSSWDRLWQCHTKLPGRAKRARIRVTSPG